MNLNNSLYFLELSNNNNLICKSSEKIKLGNGTTLLASDTKPGMIILVNNHLLVVLKKRIIEED